MHGAHSQKARHHSTESGCLGLLEKWRGNKRPESLGTWEGALFFLGEARGQDSGREESLPRLHPLQVRLDEQSRAEADGKEGVVYSQNTKGPATEALLFSGSSGGGGTSGRPRGLSGSPRGRLAPPQAAGTPSAGGVELTAGRAQAGAHRQVPAAEGAADAARHRPGARHAEVPADDPAAGAADTCEPQRLSQNSGGPRVSRPRL